MFLSIGIKYTIILISLVVLVVQLSSFPPTRPLSCITEVNYKQNSFTIKYLNHLLSEMVLLTLHNCCASCSLDHLKS